jgi:hypothetical protein
MRPPRASWVGSWRAGNPGTAACWSPSQTSVVSAGGACGRCRRPLHRDMPLSVRGTLITNVACIAGCGLRVAGCPPVGVAPLPPWHPSQTASFDGVLGAACSNPRHSSPVQTHQLPLRGPLFARSKGATDRLWRCGLEDGRTAGRETNAIRHPQGQPPHLFASHVRLPGFRSWQGVWCVGGCRRVLALRRDSPADPLPYHPGLNSAWYGTPLGCPLDRTPACQSLGRGSGPFISPVLLRAPALYLPLPGSRPVALHAPYFFFFSLGGFVDGLGESGKKGSCPTRRPIAFFVRRGRGRTCICWTCCLPALWLSVSGKGAGVFDDHPTAIDDRQRIRSTTHSNPTFSMAFGRLW